MSAFSSASRSITFALQASIKDAPNFEIWYEQHQNKLGQNDIVKYFLEVRNLSQKTGYYPLGYGVSYRDEFNHPRIKYFFENLSGNIKKLFPKKILQLPAKNILFYYWKLFVIVSEILDT